MAAGYRTPLFLLGLAGGTPRAGYRSLLAFWAGGVSAGTVIIPPEPPVEPGGWRGKGLIYLPELPDKLEEEYSDEERAAIAATIAFVLSQ